MNAHDPKQSDDIHQENERLRAEKSQLIVEIRALINPGLT